MYLLWQVWFGDFMFADNFQFYTGYKIPKVKQYEQFMHHIEQLPLVDSPEAFGLHPNADITWDCWGLLRSYIAINC